MSAVARIAAVTEGPLGVDKVLPVCGALKEIVGDGLRRGSSVSVEGSFSLALALVSAATVQGSWCAIVGAGDAGIEAAGEAGVDLKRLVCVADPGKRWQEVLASLIDGCDIVLVGDVGRLSPSQTQRFAARLRRRGSVLVSACAWPGADLRLSAGRIEWHGLGRGHGQLTEMEMEVKAEGRGAASRGLQHHLRSLRSAS